MSDAGDAVYKFVIEDGTEKKSSRDYTGKATAYYPNGDIYEGLFVMGVRDGYGVYKYASGQVYEGDFKENLKHGIGRMSYGKKGSYHGYFESGKRHGEGVFMYTNGDTYSGWWKDGLKEGKGTYIFKDTGMKLKGVWKGGNLTDGQWELPSGVHFQGTFDNNKPNGEGKWLFPNSNEVCGEYHQTVAEGDDDPPAGDEEEEEGAVKKVKVDVKWQTHPHLFDSAFAINRVL
ncbi:hypothetical protein SteCoe_31786 [Stentor coeruleus]|uniref:MORN repeat-containing protein 5 n=1 Tax=Stentor coeruleus TaxID=5963 RepID=A0A1R2B0P8_9CILI|nr:hypothetical protein SteCoe_31786 [Stentor coeruleus]